MGQFWTPIPAKGGSLLHADSQAASQQFFYIFCVKHGLYIIVFRFHPNLSSARARTQFCPFHHHEA
jgi:hypothetical protein